MIELSALRSRFGKRLLLLFVVLALVPICTLALITYRSVGGQLVELREGRLKALAKSQTMAVLERLALLEGELALLAAESSLQPPISIPEGLEAPIAVRFRRLSWFEGDREQSIHGGAIERPSLSIEQRVHLASGSPLLVLDTGTSPIRVLMARAVRLGPKTPPGELWSEIDSSYLWWGPYRENHLPPMTELCIVQASRGTTFFCSSGSPARLAIDIRSRMQTEALGELDWERGAEPHRAHYRTLRLDEVYGYSGFTVVLSEAVSRLGGPLRDFRLSFLPIVLVTLWVVLLLSIQQIRRGLRPLELLTAGTRELGGRNFSARVEISSGDEFEELAGSFNRMAHRLGTQFESLNALTEIQSSVLSADGRREIAAAMLTRLERLLPCGSARLTVLDTGDRQRVTTYTWHPGQPIDTGQQLLRVEDVWWLQEMSDVRIVDSAERLPAFLSDLRNDQIDGVAVVPLKLESKTIGVVAAGLTPGSALDRDDYGPVRQLGDQIAQALSKAALIEELEELSLGTLSALGRTIDANSRWTLGHSERVAALATSLGVSMGLSKQDLDTLERGALLHDIGKLGVPSHILNKPAKLTADERRQVELHVEIGVQILEPVPSLADTLPIVRQHHEWYDGSGYLEGLAGDEIHPLARLLAVVDCWDALRSPRPYRGAVPEPKVREHLQTLAGKQFDPAVVAAFLDLLDASSTEQGAVSPALLQALRG